MKAPVGLLSDRTVLRQQDGGASPRPVPVCRTAPNRGKAPAFQKRRQGLSLCLLQDTFAVFIGIHHTPDSYTKRELVGARPLHLAYARPFGRLKAPLGLSLLRFAAQTRTTLFLLCTKSCIVWRKIGVWRSLRWKFTKEKSLKLLGLSRSFRLCYLKIGNLLLNRLHRGELDW